MFIPLTFGAPTLVGSAPSLGSFFPPLALTGLVSGGFFVASSLLIPVV
jgi:hypothetical protein